MPPNGRNENTSEPDEGPRSFTRSLEAMNDGILVHELSLEQFKLLKLLFADAQEAGPGGDAKGELILKLKYKVGNDQTVDIVPEIQRKEPKKRRNATTAWCTQAGNISWEFPRQETLPNVSLVRQPTAGRTMPSAAAQARTMGGNAPVDDDNENGE
jgi:hypothetical protein